MRRLRYIRACHSNDPLWRSSCSSNAASFNVFGYKLKQQSEFAPSLACHVMTQWWLTTYFLLLIADAVFDSTRCNWYPKGHADSVSAPTCLLANVHQQNTEMHLNKSFRK